MHLVVIQHGLWGDASNTQYLADLLAKQLGGDACCHVLNSGVSSKLLTYDGIDVCGDRLHALIQQTHELLAKEGRAPTHISMIGYSMGGLVTRYTAGRLYADGYFQSVTALNFVTIATPHLGSWRMPANLLTRGFNAMVPILTSRSGFQLVFQDKSTFEKPLLCLMSHPKLPFMAGLRQFQNLVAMANIHHDRPVPYCTAAFALSNPYESAKAVPIDPRYPSIVRPHDAQAGDAPAPAERAVQGKSMRLLLVVFLPLMLAGLAYMTVQGKRHYAASKKLNYNTDWLAAYCHKQLQQLPAVPNANASDGSVAAAPAAEAEADAEAIDVAIDADAAVAADCPSAPTGVGLGPDGGEVIVSETQQSVVLHEGIVELPSAVHEVQEWIVKQLDQLPWRKVDVDVRHFHAHAAIMMRNPKRFMDNRDCLDYLAEQCFLQG